MDDAADLGPPDGGDGRSRPQGEPAVPAAVGEASWDDEVLAALEVGVLVVDGDLRVVRAGGAADRLLGVRAAGRPLGALVDPVDAPGLLAAATDVLARRVTTRFRVPCGVVGADLVLHLAPLPAGGMAVTVEDAAAVVADDPLLGAMRSVLDRWPGFVGITDDRANVVYLNDRARELVGFTGEGPSDLRTTDLFAPAAFARYYREIRPRLLAGETWTGMLPLATGTSEGAELRMVLSAGVGPSATIDWLVAMASPGDAGVGPEDLAYRATHDQLTGLANRSLLLDRLHLALLRRDRSHHPVCVAFDLDGFKAVNDGLGHRAGDELLTEVAARLAAAVRPSDTVARWGGDEFVVVCEDAPEPSAIGRRLGAAVGDLPVALAGGEVGIGATVGVVSSPPGPSVAEELVAAADAAMYAAKRGEDR
jgi:diguanylate cyclase (GGDEF)-like protein